MAGMDEVREALEAAEASLKASLHAIRVARAHCERPAPKAIGCAFCGAANLITVAKFDGLVDTLCGACGRDQNEA